MNNLTIIIPVYNESDTLPSILPDVLTYQAAHACQLIFVNDGSTDSSLALLQEATAGKDQIRVLSHKLNRGYGGALKTGLRNSHTEYTVFMDADGQHRLADITKLYQRIQDTDADMIIGSRKGQPESTYRSTGKHIIRGMAKLLMEVPVHDINSGMKLFRTELALQHITLYPHTMAFSDIFCLVFLNDRRLVLEEPIQIEPRKGGKSVIGLSTAINTVYEILLIVMLFNPMKIFFPVSLLFVTLGILWSSHFLMLGRGLSVGGSFLFISGVLCFLIGMLAEQVALLRYNHSGE